MGQTLSGKDIVLRSLVCLVISYLLMVLSIHPIFSLIEGLLYLFFIGMSAICVAYVLYAIVKYDNVSRAAVKDISVFCGISCGFVCCIATLSSFCCLFEIDPTNWAFFWLVGVAVVLSAAFAVFANLLSRKKACWLTVMQNIWIYITVGIALLVIVSRCALFVFDTLEFCLFYCASTVLLIAWLVFECITYRKYYLQRQTSRFSTQP